MTEEKVKQLREKTGGTLWCLRFFKHVRKASKGKSVGARIFLCFFVLGVVHSVLLGQGCAMCKTSIATQAAGLIRALNFGILVLLFPPLIIVSTIVLVIVRDRR